jgi:hypothetical protein
MAGAESERLPAAARQHDGIEPDPRHFDAGDRPGIRPGPWLDGLAIGEAPGEGAVQEDLG